MFESHWRILKGRVEIRQGKMSGVARLCEEAEISEAETVYQVHLLPKTGLIGLLPVDGMGEQASHENGLNEEKEEEEARLSHGRQSSLFTISRLMS